MIKGHIDLSVFEDDNPEPYFKIMNKLKIKKDNIHFESTEDIHNCEYSFTKNILNIVIPKKINIGITNYNWLCYEISIYTELYPDYFLKRGAQNACFDMTVLSRVVTCCRG